MESVTPQQEEIELGEVLMDQWMRALNARAQLQAMTLAPRLEIVEVIRRELEPFGVVCRPVGSAIKRVLRAIAKESPSPEPLSAQRWSGFETSGEIKVGILKTETYLTLTAQPNVWDRWELTRLGREEIRISPNGQLARLKAAALRVAMTFGWTEASATAWLLSGSAPEVAGPRIRVDGGPEDEEGAGRLWHRVSIDTPAEIAPAKVSALHQHVREKFADRQLPPMLVKIGGLGQKQIAVTHFAIERNDGRSWRAILEEWNHDATFHGLGDYDDYRALAKDVRNTFKRLMGTDLDWSNPKSNRSGDSHAEA